MPFHIRIPQGTDGFTLFLDIGNNGHFGRDVLILAALARFGTRRRQGQFAEMAREREMMLQSHIKLATENQNEVIVPPLLDRRHFVGLKRRAHINTLHFGAERPTACHNFHCPYPPELQYRAMRPAVN